MRANGSSRGRGGEYPSQVAVSLSRSRCRGEGGEERHFDKLVPVCGNQFLKVREPPSPPLARKLGEPPRVSARRREAPSRRSSLPKRYRLLLLLLLLIEKGEILLYFSKPHFVSLTAFISERFAHERIPLSISFHFTAAVSAVRKGCREKGEGNGSRRNARHFAGKNRPTSTDDRRLFEFLRVEAILRRRRRREPIMFANCTR